MGGRAEETGRGGKTGERRRERRRRNERESSPAMVAFTGKKWGEREMKSGGLREGRASPPLAFAKKIEEERGQLSFGEERERNENEF